MAGLELPCLVLFLLLSISHHHPLTGPWAVTFVYHYWWAGLQNNQIRATSHTMFGENFLSSEVMALLPTRQKSLLVCVVVWRLLSNHIFELE